VELGERVPQWTVGVDPCADRAQDRRGHPAQRGRVLMAVGALAEIDLRHGVDAVLPRRRTP
jgi:hypothetical protein